MKKSFSENVAGITAVTGNNDLKWINLLYINLRKIKLLYVNKGEYHCNFDIRAHRTTETLAIKEKFIN